MTESTRDQHLIECIKAGYPLANIKVLVGGHPRKILQRIEELCETEGLTYTPLGGGRGNYIPKFTAATSADTYQFRINLYNALTSYAEHWKPSLTNTELARVLGVTRGDVIRIMKRPHEHDWTIINLSRFAKALGTNFIELISSMTTRPIVQLPTYPEGVPIHPSQLEFHVS